MSDSARLAIDGEMTIYRAAELKPVVLNALHKHSTLELDLSGVTEIDTAGVQILVLAKQAAQAAGSILRLCAHSPAVLEVFELLDMGAYFGDAMLVTPAA